MKQPAIRLPSVVVLDDDDEARSRLASILRHENQLLRARLEGKGRVEADPELRRRLKTAEAEIRQMNDRLAKANREAGDLRQRLQTQGGQLPNLVNRIGAMSDQLGRHNDRLTELNGKLSEFKKHNQAEVQQSATEAELKAARGRIERLSGDLDLATSELVQARADLERLLTQLRSTPFVRLLRRSSRFRAIEARWG